MANFDNIIQEININLPDNGTQAITAAKLRTTLIDLTAKIDTVQDDFEDNIENILQTNTTFASGQKVNETYIDNDFSGGSNKVAGADEVKTLNEKNEILYDILDVEAGASVDVDVKPPFSDFVPGAYTNSLEHFTPSPTSKTCLIETQEGESITISGKCVFSNYRVFNNSGIEIKNGSAAYFSEVTNGTFVMPPDAKYLQISLNNVQETYDGLSITAKRYAYISKTLNEFLNKNVLNHKERINFANGQFYTNQGVGNVCAKDFYYLSTTQCVNIPVSEGDTFLLIDCVGGNGPRQYCFLDSDDIILEVANAASTTSPLTIVAPEHATQLIVNSLNLIGELYKISEYDTLDDYLNGVGLSEYEALDIKLNGIFTDSYYNRNSGAIVYSTLGNCRTDYLNISGFDKILFSRNTQRTTPGDTASIVFFDENHTFISGEGYLQDTTLPEGTSSIKLETIEVPTTAKYCGVGMMNPTWAEQIVVKGLIKNADASPYNNSKFNELPYYTSWRSRYSLMKNFGTQPAANGSSGSFCDVLSGGYNDLITAVYEPLRALYPNYITRTNIGKDASDTIDMFVYDFQPKYYQQHIYLQAGIHAVEPDAVSALARIMQLIANAYDGDDDDLKFMRENIRFTVVPVVNVWGFSQNPKNNQNSLSQNMQAWENTNTPQELQNIKNYINNNNILKEFSFMMDMHTTTNSTYSNFYGALQRHSQNARTIFRVNSWLYDNFIPSRGVVHNEGKDLGYRETSPNIFRMYWYKKGVQTFTAEFTDYIWDGNNLATSPVISVAVSMYLNYLIQMMNDFYISMYDVPNSDYHQTAG